MRPRQGWARRAGTNSHPNDVNSQRTLLADIYGPLISYFGIVCPPVDFASSLLSLTSNVASPDRSSACWYDPDVIYCIQLFAVAPSV